MVLLRLFKTYMNNLPQIGIYTFNSKNITKILNVLDFLATPQICGIYSLDFSKIFTKMLRFGVITLQYVPFLVKAMFPNFF